MRNGGSFMLEDVMAERSRLVLAVSLAGVLAWACSGGDEGISNPTGGTAGSGGSAATGGTAGTGGNAGSSGTAGTGGGAGTAGIGRHSGFGWRGWFDGRLGG
jgi:hypothetical protein